MQNILRSGKWLILFMLLAGVFSSIGAGAQEKSAEPGGQLLVNADEAECVLAIVEKNAAKQKIEEADWQRLFASEPYIRLKKREAEIAVRFDAPDLVFNDEQFKEFVLGAEPAKNAPALRRTLEAWRQADMGAVAGRLLAYLPAGAAIKAKVYPVVKPRTNSFVYELDSDPAIFLYLDPKLSREQFENTVAHELHHIGFASIESRLNMQSAAASAELNTALKWLGAFGEGFAMLAAAGGPDVDPHRYSPEVDQVRWRKDMANFNENLGKLEKFFLDILGNRLAGKDKIDEAAFAFFGVQGPWYTVGYKMAAMVEKREGRAALIRCMEDPRLLLREYNRLAAKENERGAKLAIWSAELLAKLGI